jgi:hydrogenase maturation protease
VHLAYELLEGYDGVVIVDAVPMGETPGALAVIEPEFTRPGPRDDDAAPVIDAHTMSPDVVLAMLARLGGSVERIFIVGCQPGNLEEGMGLTPAVAAVVDAAVEMCRQLVSELAEPVGKGTHP